MCRFAALSRRLRECRKKEPTPGESQLLLSGSAQQENGGSSIPV